MFPPLLPPPVGDSVGDGDGLGSALGVEVGVEVGDAEGEVDSEGVGQMSDPRGQGIGCAPTVAVNVSVPTTATTVAHAPKINAFDRKLRPL
jgi:hypothetical protein